MGIPSFSIIIPTRNRPKQLAACLQAIAELDYPSEHLEVIVVDDGSTMDLAAVLQPFLGNPRIKLIRQLRGGPAAARNTGAKIAGGEILAFTDDDCKPAKTWLKAFAQMFQTHPRVALGGQTLNALPENLYSTASQILTTYLYAYYNPDPSNATFFASNNLAVPRQDFNDFGGFNEFHNPRAAEDREFCDAWVQTGRRLTYAPEAIVNHAHELTFFHFLKQHFGYGRGAPLFHLNRARRGLARPRVEPLSFYSDLLAYPYTKAPAPDQRFWLMILLLITQIANLLGYLWQRLQMLVYKDPVYR